MPSFLLFALFASLVSNAIGAELKISSADGLIEFKDNVNSGTTYSGTTVLLDSDLSLTDKEFEPIGHNSSYCFKGTFDGQGYVIRNLAINTSSSQYTGLFGHSEGPIIRNVILDSSCSITSSFSDSSSAYVGGIVGDFRSDNEIFAIENSVNMASVSFIGNVSGNSLFVGGIAGYAKYSFFYGLNITNCANYGDVTHSGTSESSYVGGTIGYFDGSSTKTPHIYNSLNAGKVTHSGKTSWILYLGGVVGYVSSGTDIDNCVSAGKIESTGTASVSYIGSIVGEIWSGVYASHCYITSELRNYRKYGSGSPTSESNTLSYDSSTFELSGTVSAGDYTGTSLINALNAADYYDFRGYSRWLLNKNSNTVTFKISNDRTTTISLSYR